MRSEAEFCTVIGHSLVTGYKIPDESGFQFGAKTSIRCFDGIGMLPENCLDKSKDDNLVFIPWEAKHLKDMSAFSLKRVETHQDYYLSEYSKAKSVYPLLIVGVSVSRGDNRAYIFDYRKIGHRLFQAEFSIHKKFLEKLPYNPIHKGKFNFDNILTEEDFVKVYDDKDFWKKIEETINVKQSEKNSDAHRDNASNE